MHTQGHTSCQIVVQTFKSSIVMRARQSQRPSLVSKKLTRARNHRPPPHQVQQRRRSRSAPRSGRGIRQQRRSQTRRSRSQRARCHQDPPALQWQGTRSAQSQTCSGSPQSSRMTHWCTTCIRERPRTIRSREHVRGAGGARVNLSVEQHAVDDVEHAIGQEDVRLHDLGGDVP